tara:strand:- start:258 stop:758 length:501 start_codon:yes stop_codon:yes gene_type:complete
MNKIYITSILLLAGCVSSQKAGHEPVTSEQYDPDQVAQRAKELGLRPVDYLHRANNGRLIFYQAYDSNWDDPTINPIFFTEAEAKEYAQRNNMGATIARDTSHSYIVREVNYRFEVRQVNDVANEVLHTSLLLKDSEEYVNHYSLNHTDLLIYDLKTGIVVGTSTP